jgi:competence protein ComEC
VVSLSIRAGATRTIDGLGVGVLWPDAATALRATDANARSLVLIVRYGAVDALLLGDAPLGVQRRIEPGRASAMRRTIVKAAHHGSATAGFAPWAADRAPDFAVVSVGRGNRFGHPSPVVLDRWRRVGALVHRTDVAGALHVATDGARVWSAAVGDPALRIRR